MNKSANILFQLLRAALGGETEVSLPDDVDWNEVVDLAFEQGVAALMVDGLQRSLELRGESLENDLLESEDLEDLRYELFGEALACEEELKKWYSLNDNRKNLVKYALEKIGESRSYAKFNVPTDYLKLSSVGLATDQYRLVFTLKNDK